MLRIGLLIVLSFLFIGAFAQENSEKAAELRKNEEFDKAEKLLKDYKSPAGFDSLNSADKIKFLRGLLELAHIKSLQDDVNGALSLLNWAESRTDDYQRAIACIKYGEILLDMGEFERAGAYLKNADEIINKRVTDSDTGAAIGQGGEHVDTGATWRELRDQSDALKAEVEAEQMKAKFGATYGSYVKLRRLQKLVKRSKTPRYRNEALKVAAEIIETDPASQFAAAAGYLKGEIMASHLTEKSPKKDIAEVKTYLINFVKERPDGLYRGEALMLLGKINLEIEWNAKEAEKYFTQALSYFRKAREKRDAISLYVAINDDLKNQIQPTKKPTSLDQWKRTVYHDEDPLKLYNIDSPVWYLNDKEKNILLILGFLALSAGNSDQAKSHWEKIQVLDETTGSENSQYPCLLKRLMSACKFKMFILSNDELSEIKDNNIRLKLNYASMLFMLEHFTEADQMFDNIFQSTEDMNVKALCMLCRSEIADNTTSLNSKEIAISYLNWILSNDKLRGSFSYGSALYKNANTYMSIYQGFNKALPIPAGNNKASFEYTTTSGGIFRVKVELDLGNNIKLTEGLKRQTDDAHSNLVKGSPDAFGVCDSDVQIYMYSRAASFLGSTAFAQAVSRPHVHDGDNITEFPAPSNKCNLFVCEAGHRDTNSYVPIINVTGIWPFQNFYPPTANQWAGTDVKDIPGWSITQAPPQPGYVWARPQPLPAPGHCGIVAHDGRVISAGGTNVNRNEADINNPLRVR